MSNNISKVRIFTTMKNVYFDNAATTPIRPEVIDVMAQSMANDFGNPSSTHSYGRTAKSSLELSRKQIAAFLNCSSAEILFTSGATEANNWLLRSAVQALKVVRIVTSKIEHHAVLHAVQALEAEFNIEVQYVTVKPNGLVCSASLVEILGDKKPTLVSLMHVNNETGVILDVNYIAKICKEHQAYFHTDAVQSVGKLTMDLQETPIDFLVATAHKFHGPKGIGFAFVRKGLFVNSMIIGGAQEKGLRAGTEAMHNIVGMAKALELSYAHLEKEQAYIADLKNYCTQKLKEKFEGVSINGDQTIYSVINVTLPFSEEKTPLVLFYLDMKGIAISRGSACQSGSSKPSHVLAEMLSDPDLKKPSLRISFSHYNTKDEIDLMLDVLQTI